MEVKGEGETALVFRKTDQRMYNIYIIYNIV